MNEVPKQTPGVPDNREKLYSELGDTLKGEVNRLEDVLGRVRNQILQFQAQGLLSEEGKSSSLDRVELILRKIEISRQEETEHVLKYVESKISSAADLWEKKSAELGHIAELVSEYDDLVINCQSLARDLPAGQESQRESIYRSAKIGSRRLDQEILTNLDEKNSEEVVSELQKGIVFWREKRTALEATIPHDARPAHERQVDQGSVKMEWNDIQSRVQDMDPSTVIRLLSIFAQKYPHTTEAEIAKERAYREVEKMFGSLLLDQPTVATEKGTGEKFVGRIVDSKTTDKILTLAMEKKGEIAWVPLLREGLSEIRYETKPEESQKYNRERTNTRVQLSRGNIMNLQRFAETCSALGFREERDSVDQIMRTIQDASNLFGTETINLMKKNGLNNEEKQKLIGEMKEAKDNYPPAPSAKVVEQQKPLDAQDQYKIAQEPQANSQVSETAKPQTQLTETNQIPSVEVSRTEVVSIEQEIKKENLIETFQEQAKRAKQLVDELADKVSKGEATEERLKELNDFYKDFRKSLPSRELTAEENKQFNEVRYALKAHYYGGYPMKGPKGAKYIFNMKGPEGTFTLQRAADLTESIKEKAKEARKMVDELKNRLSKGEAVTEENLKELYEFLQDFRNTFGATTIGSSMTTAEKDAHYEVESTLAVYRDRALVEGPNGTVYMLKRDHDKHVFKIEQTPGLQEVFKHKKERIEDIVDELRLKVYRGEDVTDESLKELYQLWVGSVRHYVDAPRDRIKAESDAEDAFWRAGNELSYIRMQGSDGTGYKLESDLDKERFTIKKTSDPPYDPWRSFRKHQLGHN